MNDQQHLIDLGLRCKAGLKPEAFCDDLSPMTLVGTVGRDTWTRQALCAGHPDRGAWFPENPQDAKRAKAVCRACPVSAECLAFALKTGQSEGIWGGTTPYERRRIRRAGLAAAPATPAPSH